MSVDSKYETITVVVDTEDGEELRCHIVNHPAMRFVTFDEGITALAYARGADPTQWEA